MTPHRLLLAPSFLSLCLVLAGCGSSSPAPTMTYPSLTGNWQIQTGPMPSQGIPTAAGILLTGSLVQTGSDVTGTLLFEDLRSPLNPCAQYLTTLAISGTISSSGAVRLASPVGGGTATIALSWPTTATPFVDATITITGGTCALAATPSLAGLIPNISGTYSGNVTITNTTTQASSTGTATLQLGQLSSPNSQGQFALSGTLAVTSSVCSETSAMNGEVGGLSFELTLPDPNSPAADVSLNGATDPAVPAAGLSFGADYASFNAGTCSGNLVIGTLTAQ